MDDFDDLLNEIENDLNKPKQKKKSPHKTTKSPSALEDDIDSILEDDEISDSRTTTAQSLESMKRTTTSPVGTVKCTTIYVGGSKTPSGQSSVTSKRSCDRLRCTSCDFRVEQFNDFEWIDSVDYLFLRNNMPDFKKLLVKLRKKSGSRAYACQCSWKSVKNLSNLQHASLKWVCGKH